MMIGQLADGIATALVGIISDRTGKVSLFAISELPYSFYSAPRILFGVRFAFHFIMCPNARLFLSAGSMGSESCGISLDS